MYWDGFTTPVRSQLRSLANDGDDSPLKIVVTAETELSQIFTDSGGDSPFENISSDVKLQPWQESTLRSFINDRLANNPIQFSDDDIKELIVNSGGNPRNLVKQCYELYKKYQQK